MDYLNLTKQDLNAEKKLAEIYEKKLSDMPDGSITFKNIRGNTYYYHVMPISRKQKYIRKNNRQLINKLKEKRLILESLKVLYSNIELQEAVLNIYKSYAPVDIYNEIKAVHKNISLESIMDDENIRMSKTEHQNKDTKSSSSYHQNNYDDCSYADAGEDWHETTFGLKVRSKSEAIIAEILYSEGIDFEYEAPLHLFDENDGEHLYYPDFKLQNKSGETIYWEHFGLMNRYDYRERNFNKLTVFYFNNILLGENLIITNDNKNGKINVSAIMKIVNSLKES